MEKKEKITDVNIFCSFLCDLLVAKEKTEIKETKETFFLVDYFLHNKQVWIKTLNRKRFIDLIIFCPFLFELLCTKEQVRKGFRPLSAI